MLATDIQCVDCGAAFPFTQEEQEFYESKGFQPPRRCKPCRAVQKSNRNGGGFGGNRGGGYGGGYDRPQRPMFDAVCAGCGINTQVPFQPNGSKPVYCRDCFQARAAY